MGTITVNGNSYVGNSLRIKNGKIIIDGKETDNIKDLPKVEITVQGDVESIKVDTCDFIKVDGNAHAITTTSGDIEIKGSVTDFVSTTSGEVKCHDILGNVTTISGDVTGRVIQGNVKTVSGDINRD